MDRRAFMTRSALLTAAGCVTPAIAHATRTPGAIAVFDSTLAQGRALADHAAHIGMPAFDTGDDIGALWYTTLAPHLARTRGLLIGVTRHADYFVLTQFLAHRIDAVQLQRAGSSRMDPAETPVFIIDCASARAT
ncbi:hypothetical protein [Paraburkholderia sp. GAS334]|uniref:hypothetical protein n=1 Tax=Paraburkholderia sp. GAS334 TaxID=3035131 RepID=UPI003D20F037